MKIITLAGCVMLSSAVLAGDVACKKAAPTQDAKVSNTGKATSTPPAARKTGSTFLTNEKTSSGEDIYRLQTGGIKFVLPKSWSALPDESQMSLASEDNALRIMIIVPETEDYDQVVNTLSDQLNRVIQNAKPDGVAERTKLNGMTALTQHGVGDLDDTTVIWKIDVVKAKRPIIILSYATTQIDEPHNADYTAFMDSILPLG